MLISFIKENKVLIKDFGKCEMSPNVPVGQHIELCHRWCIFSPNLFRSVES